MADYSLEVSTCSTPIATSSSMSPVSNPITAKSEAGPVWSTDNSSENISETNKRLLQRYLKRHNISLTQEEIAKTKELMQQQAAKLGIDVNDLSEEEKIFYAGLLIEMQRGNLTADEVMAITEEFGNDTVKEKVKALKLENGGGVDENKLAQYRAAIQKLAKMHSVMTTSSAKQIYGKDSEETTRLREEFLVKTQKSAEKDAETKMKAAVEALSENCSPEDAKAIIAATGEYANIATESLTVLAKFAGFSTKVVDSLANIAKTISENLQNTIEKTIKWFFSTPKGQAMKESYIDKKEEYKATEAKVNQKTEEANAAEKKALEALEAAKIAEKNAKATVASLGFKNPNDKQFNTILRKTSSTQWLKLQWAKEDQKKAEDVAYDAASAKRLAENDKKWALANLELIKTQIQAAIFGLLR